MKKKLKYAIVAVVILAISFLYAHVDKKIPIYDSGIDTSYYGNMGVLDADYCVSQEFVCERPVLDGVSIKCGIIGNPVTAVYQYQIIDAASGDVLREGTVDGSQVQNSRYYTIRFEQIKECDGRELIFTFRSEDSSPENALTVYNVPKGEENADLYLNGDEFPGNTLALRTVSHLFDLETFVSVTFCLVYLYIFIKILYKFFS
ncbi:MAG: hypothetical protein MR308_00745 [Lachnospiraceae bacterium]|nr:hypothetical protein [Lachnospiraceae bacterium]